MGEVVPFRRNTMKLKQTINPAPGIAELENELVRLSIELILNDDYGAKDIKREIAEIENRIGELKMRERNKK